MGVYYTVKICFAYKTWACLGESWIIREKVVARKAAGNKKKRVLHAKKKDKKNTLGINLGKNRKHTEGKRKEKKTKKIP